MEVIDTNFACWQIRWDAHLTHDQITLVWQVASRYNRECLTIHLLTDNAQPWASVCVFPGGQVEINTQIPLTVYADPRAAILSLELTALFAVRDGVLNIEPD